MRIEVSRSGGVAGMTRRGVVDTDASDDTAGWEALVAAAQPVAAPPAASPPAASPVRDGFTWTVVVGEQRAQLGDTQLAGPLRDLAERTLREGRVGR